VFWLEKYCPFIISLLVTIFPFKPTCYCCGEVCHKNNDHSYYASTSLSSHLYNLKNGYIYQCYDCEQKEIRAIEEERGRTLEELRDCQFYDHICNCNNCPECFERKGWILDFLEAQGIVKIEKELSQIDLELNPSN
jgi:tRNA(His) 5'-end guanylyltransferase